MGGASRFLCRLYEVSGTSTAVLYVAFSLSDMLLSLSAFTLGVPEANPLMAWLTERGLFVQGKVLLTGLTAGMIAWLYPRARGRPVAWSAVLLTAGVNVYHVWGLSLL